MRACLRVNAHQAGKPAGEERGPEKIAKRCAAQRKAARRKPRAGTPARQLVAPEAPRSQGRDSVAYKAPRRRTRSTTWSPTDKPGEVVLEDKNCPGMSKKKALNTWEQDERQ